MPSLIERNFESLAAIRRLWTAVLVRCVQDVAGNDKKLALDAEQFLTGPDSDLAFRVCGLDRDCFLEGLQRALRNRKKLVTTLEEKSDFAIERQSEAMRGVWRGRREQIAEGLAA